MKNEIYLGVNSSSQLIQRKNEESLPNNIRSEFMRDRDRLLYSEPFRRLAGKTQVYTVGNSDHMRTRLTHTLEVSQIARTISAYLNLNCDLTEAIALGHDIGHTPFGHTGERTLHSIMTPHEDHYIKKCPFNIKPLKFDNQYGFKHNLHGVKLAYSSGLNLTNYTLYGVQAHSKLKYDKSYADFHELGFYKQYQKQLSISNNNTAWSFEAYVVAIADEIAQRHHDLEDAIIGKLITKKEVNEIASNYLQKDFQLDVSLDDKLYEKRLSSFIVNKLVSELLISAQNNILQFQAQYEVTKNNSEEIFSMDIKREELSKVIAYSEEFKEKEHGFAEEIKNRVVSSYEIQVADSRGAYVIKKLFQAFYSSPQQLPDNSIVSYLLRAEHFSSIEEINNIRQEKGIGYLRNEFNNKYKTGGAKNDILLMRVICDHIAGMTDNYALNTYRKLYGYGSAL